MLLKVLASLALFQALPNDFGGGLLFCSIRGSDKENNFCIFKIHFGLFSYLTLCPSVNCEGTFIDLSDFFEQIAHVNINLQQKSSNTLPKGTRRTAEKAIKQQPGQITMTELS